MHSAWRKFWKFDIMVVRVVMGLPRCCCNGTFFSTRFLVNEVVRIIDMGVHRLSPLADRYDLVCLRNPVACGETTSEVKYKLV